MTYIPQSAIPEDEYTPSSAVSADEPSLIDKAGGILNTVADLFVGRTRDVGELSVGSVFLEADRIRKAKESDELFEKSQDLINRARTETNPIRKKQLLDESRRLDSKLSDIGDTVTQNANDLQEIGRVSDADLNRNRFDFATRRGVGMAAEQAALLAPASSTLKGFQAAMATRGVFGKMLAAGVIGGTTAGTLSATDAQVEDVGDALKRFGEDGAKGFITSAAIVGGIELGKTGLKVAGNVIKSVLPSKETANRLFASAFNVPARIARRLRPVETADEIADYGINGSLDEMDDVVNSVTGANGTVTKATRSALGAIKNPIDSTSAVSAAKDQLDNAAMVDDRQTKKILKHIQKMIKPDTGLKPGQNQALDVFDSIQELEEVGYSYINKSTPHTPNINAEQIGEVYLTAADELKMAIDRSSVDEQVLAQVKTPQIIKALEDISPKLANKFKAAESISDLRAIQSPFVRLGQMIRLTTESSNTTFARNLRANAPLSRSVVNTVTQSPTVRTGFAQGLRSIAPAPTAVSGATNLINQGVDRTASGAESILPTLVGFIQGKR